MSHRTATNGPVQRSTQRRQRAGRPGSACRSRSVLRRYEPGRAAAGRPGPAVRRTRPGLAVVGLPAAGAEVRAPTGRRPALGRARLRRLRARDPAGLAGLRAVPGPAAEAAGAVRPGGRARPARRRVDRRPGRGGHPARAGRHRPLARQGAAGRRDGQPGPLGREQAGRWPVHAAVPAVRPVRLRGRPGAPGQAGPAPAPADWRPSAGRQGGRGDRRRPRHRRGHRRACWPATAPRWSRSTCRPPGEALAEVANRVGGTALQLDVTAPDAGRRIADHAHRAARRAGRRGAQRRHHPGQAAGQHGRPSGGTPCWR